MDLEILQQIGLSKNEIKVYFTLLELEQSTATPIVKQSKIPNSKIYPTLEKLISKGLASFVIKNNVKYFQASDPRNLIELLQDRETEIAHQKKELEKFIPQIELKRKMFDYKQEAIVYEELGGVKTALNDILNTLKKGEEYLVFTLGDELGTDKLKMFFLKYHQKRMEKKIKVRLIVNEKIKKIFNKNHIYSGMKVKYSKLKLPTGIFIYGNKVMTLVWGEKPTAFVIASTKNSDRYKEFFEEMWAQL